MSCHWPEQRCFSHLLPKKAEAGAAAPIECRTGYKAGESGHG